MAGVEATQVERAMAAAWVPVHQCQCRVGRVMPTQLPETSLGSAVSLDAIFAEQQKMTRAEEAKLFRSRAAEYQAESSGRRTEAMALAAAAREGKPVNQSAKEIRSGLKRDLTEWRDTFKIDRKSWQDIRDKTLADEGDLTPAQWAERRAEWFDARDQWIEKQKDWASKSSDTEQ